MKDHLTLSSEQFEQMFQNASFPPKLFTHEAHIRLAWIHIKKYGLEQAEKNICEQIAAFDQLHGDGTKYNTTVTIAAVKIVHHFIEKSLAGNFVDFMYAFPQLKNNFRGLINTHYSIDIFKDELAKKTFIEPDLIAF